MRGWGPLPVILGCILLSTGAWGQPSDAGVPGPPESLDAGQTSPGALGASGVPDAGQTSPGALGASGAPDAGQTAPGSRVPSVTPDAGLLNPGQVQVTLHGVPVTVTASSVLVDAKDPGRYGPANLLDEDPGTLWAEGAKGTGAGEWVELSFPPETPVHAFLVTPGNPKSAKLYKANARPRKARLDLRLHDGRRMGYELDFPRDFPAGGAIYVSYERQFAVKSAKLTVLTVWPGSRYRDLCMGGFVPVFRGPPKRHMETFMGTGTELAPTLAMFMRSPSLVFNQLPPETSGVPARLRSFPKVPHNGPLSEPVEEFNMYSLSGWDRYGQKLAEAAAGASLQSELFRLLPPPGGQGYVFGPVAPPKGPDSFSNFRVHWAQVEGMWRVVGVDVTYSEQTADD